MGRDFSQRHGAAWLSYALLLLLLTSSSAYAHGDTSTNDISTSRPLDPREGHAADGATPALLWPGAPPLPVVNEVQTLVDFAVRNLDDATEDAAKLALLFGCFQLVSRPLAMFGPTQILMLPPAAGALAAVVGYPLADRAADAVGDRAAYLQNAIRRALGMPPQPSEAEPLPEDVGFVVRNVDDVVEDAFKLGCVASHYQMGALLGGTMRRALAALTADMQDSPAIGVMNAAIGAAVQIVKYGTPAGRYAKCNSYGDKLGDWVQQWLPT